jgi:hypothetical protein
MREIYKDKRREEKRLFRRKKYHFLRRQCEDIEMLRDRNEIRKFYKKVKRLSEGFKTSTSSCRDKEGNLVTDAQGTLAIWRDRFSKSLNGDDVQNNTREAENVVSLLVSEYEEDEDQPNLEEVTSVISRHKNNKSTGVEWLPAELFKSGGIQLERCMHRLVCLIWSEERMPNDWSQSILCPVLKKGDPTICSNYRGISLLSTAYKVLSGVLCNRLKPFMDKLIGSYQCGFRPGKSTIDQVFTLRQILEKTQEKQIDTHHLFVVFKAAFDSPVRYHLYNIMSEFGIPNKLIRLRRMTLTNTQCVVQVGKELSEPFETKNGFRQGDTLSCDFFNLVMEKIMRTAELVHNGTIFYKSVMPLAYADDVDIIGRSSREVSAAFTRFEEASKNMGLAVNENKTKYFVSTNGEMNLGTTIPIGSYNFEIVKDFVYLGSSVNMNNNISLKVKRRVTLANRCYFGLSNQLRNKALSRRTKLQLYETLI